MKKIFLALSLLLVSSVSFAAGTVTFTKVHYSNALKVIQIEIAAGNNGAFTDWVIKDSDSVTYNVNGYIVQGDTEPGTITPSTNYDITLLSAGGIDRFGTALTNRSATTPQTVRPLLNGNDTGIMNYGPLTLTLSGNSVTGALVKFKLYFVTMD